MKNILVHCDDNLWDLISYSLEDVINKPTSIQIRSLQDKDFENKEWFDDEWTKKEFQKTKKDFVVFEIKKD